MQDMQALWQAVGLGGRRAARRPGRRRQGQGSGGGGCERWQGGRRNAPSRFSLAAVDASDTRACPVQFQASFWERGASRAASLAGSQR